MGNLISTQRHGGAPKTVADRGERKKTVESKKGKKWWFLRRNNVQPEVRGSTATVDNIPDAQEKAITVTRIRRLAQLFTTEESGELKASKGVSEVPEKFDTVETVLDERLKVSPKDEILADSESKNAATTILKNTRLRNTRLRKRGDRRRERLAARRSRAEKQEAGIEGAQVEKVDDDVIERTMAARRGKIAEIRKRMEEKRRERAAKQNGRSYEDSFAKLRAMAKLD
ncbi:caldesmon-like [Ptychodera flava]|uniref:caldesmon-like n=1 Tax=Ptychodera flava TaxID=63121 RepID=UPI00396A3780